MRFNFPKKKLCEIRNPPIIGKCHFYLFFALFFSFNKDSRARVCVFVFGIKGEEVEEQLANAWGGWEGGVPRRDLVVCFVLYR